VAALPDLSVQLYSVRGPFARDPGGTLARLAEIGFRRVEPFQLLEHAAALEGTLADSGLAAPTTHAHLVGVEDVAEVFEAAVALGIGTVVEPMVAAERWTSRAGVEEIAAELSALARAAVGHGLRVGYHNHWFELESVLDGRPALEVLADALDPAVLLEVDTYWAAVGGQDVPALLRRLGGRVRALHLKDGPIDRDDQRQQPLGRGAMPVPAVVAAAPAVEVPVLEFDAYAGDIFEGLALSYEYASGLEPAG
jgi:sugar phosphate isomerase/epimerase